MTVHKLRIFAKGGLNTSNLLSLANIVIAVFVVSFGPFILMGQMPQIISRLFPFKRGLNHAYWAPNGWALVTAADRVILQGKCFYTSSHSERLRKSCWDSYKEDRRRLRFEHRGRLVDVKGTRWRHRICSTPECQAHTHLCDHARFTERKNTVQYFCLKPRLRRHSFPQIFMIKLWRNPTYKSFLCALTLCGYVSYMFGWHVHEKAVLLVLVPLRYAHPLLWLVFSQIFGIDCDYKQACSLRRTTHFSGPSSSLVWREYIPCSHFFSLRPVCHDFSSLLRTKHDEYQLS